MRNKKNEFNLQEHLMIYGWGYLSLIIAFAFLFYFGIFSSKPQFIITTEECVNDSFKLEIYGDDYCYSILHIKSSNEHFIIYDNLQYTNCNFNKPDFGMVPIPSEEKILSKEVCNQVEVDEIKIVIDRYYELKSTDECCAGCVAYESEPAPNYGANGEVNTYYRCLKNPKIDEGVITAKILKSDLTIEWLDENCYCPCNEELCVVIDSKEIKGVNIEGCKKYKCGDYFVEVK